MLKIIRDHLKPDQMVFVGVINPIDPRIETPEEVCDRVLEAAEYIPLAQLGTCDDCGFSPFCDDTTHDPGDGVCEDPCARRRDGARERTDEGHIVASDSDEEARLRAVALQNAQSILVARRRAEEALRQQSEWLRITLASIGDAVITTDAEGRVTSMNAVAQALTGWSQTDALGHLLTDVFQIVHEETRQPVENPAIRALQTSTIIRLANHTVLLARTGEEHPIDDSAAPIRDESGATIGAVLVFRDVSERKRTDLARAHLAAIVESSEDAIVSKTLQGIILSWNKGAERLFGYTASEAIGQPITMLIPPERLDEEQRDPGAHRSRRSDRAL